MSHWSPRLGDEWDESVANAHNGLSRNGGLSLYFQMAPAMILSGAQFVPAIDGENASAQFAQACRILDLSECLPLHDHNAMLHVFSTKGERLEYGRRHYHLRSAETSSLLRVLLQKYQQEKLTMPDLLEELTREVIEQLLKDLPPEKLLERLSPEKRLEGLSPEKRLEGLSPEKRLEGLSPEERVKGLSPEMLRALADQLSLETDAKTK